MAVNLSPYGGVGAQFFSNNGVPLAGGKIFTYAAGTTTPQATYTSASGSTAHANPIILDAAGRVPGGEIWLTDGLQYKFVLKDANDITLATYDNVVGINSNFINYTNEQEIQTATAGQTVFTLTTMQYQPGTGSLSVFVDGVNQYGPGAQYAFVETDSTTVTFVTGLHVGASVKFTTSAINASSYGDAAQIGFTGFAGQIGSVQDLAGNDGSNWIGFEASGTGAVARSAQAKMRDVVSVKDFGAVGDSNGTTGNGTDDTAAVQAAIDYIKASGGGYSLYVPEGTYRLTSRLLIDSAVRVVGEGCSPYVTTPGTRGNGSWLYFDHTGKGLQIDGTAALAGVAFEHFGTFRNQPTPGVGWAPTAHDYDIYVDNADVTIDDVVLLNPTKGFKLTNTNYGRLTIKRLRGQPLQIGIDIDECYDLPQISDVHFWPYWKDDSNVHAYTLQNLDAIYLRRVDNPQLVNIFTIYARAGIRITKSSAGSVSKLHVVNADFDRGKYGIWVDSTVTVADGQFENVTSQGETGVSETKGIFLQGTNTSFYFGNYSSAYTAHNAVRVDGTGNRITFAAAKANYYDQSGVGYPAFEAATGNWLIFATEPEDYNGGAGGTFSTTGNIVADKWRSFGPTVTSSSGTITSYTSSGKYKVVGDTVHVQVAIDITNNGTGSGNLRVTIPFSTTSLNRFTGVGKEILTTGNALVASIAPGNNYAEITTYSNAYPVSTGSFVVCVFQYDVTV